MQLQYNKVDNLKIVIEKINGTLIKPGNTFSFCKTVGLLTKRKGYKLGMELSFGEAKAGIGGGICQSSNLLHWLALHSPLTINERHHHSFAYHVFEKNHKFLKRNDEFFRANEIWRNKNAKFRSGELIETELITKNFGRVLYEPEEFEVETLL